MYNVENELVLENLFTHRVGADDGLKLGLVIQGGGMRGAFGAGIAIEMTRLGLNENFDVIHASSSGANTAAYMITGQTIEGTEIFRNDLSRFRFIKPWHLGKTMNLDYLIDFLMQKKRPLDLEKFKKSKTLLKMYVTNYESGFCEYFTNHQKVDPVLALKATCAYPNHFPPVQIGENKYLDGNIATILPIEQAIEDGCTDIVVITTVPESHIEHPQPKSRQAFQNLMSRKFTIDFKEVRKHRVDLYNHSLDLAFGREIPNDEVRIFTFSPDYLIANASIRQKTLRKYVEHGKAKARKVLTEVLAV